MATTTKKPPVRKKPARKLPEKQKPVSGKALPEVWTKWAPPSQTPGTLPTKMPSAPNPSDMRFRGPSGSRK